MKLKNKRKEMDKKEYFLELYYVKRPRYVKAAHLKEPLKHSRLESWHSHKRWRSHGRRGCIAWRHVVRRTGGSLLVIFATASSEAGGCNALRHRGPQCQGSLLGSAASFRLVAHRKWSQLARRPSFWRFVGKWLGMEGCSCPRHLHPPKSARTSSSY